MRQCIKIQLVPYLQFALIQSPRACMDTMRNLRVAIVDEQAVAFKQLVGASHMGFRLGHRRRIEENQRLVDVVVGAKAADGAGRRADDRCRFLVP